MNTITNVKLWAIQLQVAAKPSPRFCQVIVEANDLNEAQERAKERFRRDHPARLLAPDEITVHATAEISLENIWIFNDPGFRHIE